MTSLTTILNTKDIIDVVRTPIYRTYTSYYPYRRVMPKQVVGQDPAPGRFKPNPALGDNHSKHEKILDALKGMMVKQNVSQKVEGEGTDEQREEQRVEQVLKTDRSWRS